jgi:NAD+ kinase
MKVALYGRRIKTPELKAFYDRFISILEKNKIEYQVCSSFGKFLRLNYGVETETCENEDLNKQNFDYLISLGGDGTALDTLLLVKDSALPVMGINLGRLGFLANIKMNEVEEAILALKDGNTSILERSIIQVTSDNDEINKFPFALNDFVVQKRDTSAMITVKASLDGHLMNNYWSDGLIVATPTGSSGYSLSCGGPLLFPGSKSFVITPIAAHNLTVRPAVIPDNTVIEIETSGRSDTVLITLDSRSFVVPSNTKLSIQRANFNFVMVQLKGTNYMDTIRNKLLWGADKRDGA